MPTKRSTDEIGRPPLARGSACHRCFARKVRCSGMPNEEGVNACSACLRTARFKNHDLSQVRCSFNNDGLCSEEGGLQMNGEPISSSFGGPTRRKLGSRTNTASSKRSVSSRSSSSSTIRSDASTISSSDSVGTISPASSLESVPTISKFPEALSNLPEPPQLYHQYSSIPFQFPPPLPPSMHFTSLYDRPFPPSLRIPASTSTSMPSSTSSSARCSRDNSPVTPIDPPPPLFARRSRQGPPMQISLPTNNRSGHSSTASFSTNSSVAPSLDSAPLQTPASWGNPHVPSSIPRQHQGSYGAPTPLPLTQLALDLAPYSAMSPSSLTKFAAASVPSFDFYPQAPLVDAYPATTVGDLLAMSQANAPYGYADQPSYPSQAQFMQYPLAPSTPYRVVDNFSLDNSSTFEEFDPTAFGGSFHLASPGLTFSSSTPSWMAKNQYFCA